MEERFIKGLFLILSWLIMYMPCYMMIENVMEDFKDVKTTDKALKILASFPFILMATLITLLVMERFINFNRWQFM